MGSHAHIATCDRTSQLAIAHRKSSFGINAYLLKISCEHSYQNLRRKNQRKKKIGFKSSKIVLWNNILLNFSKSRIPFWFTLRKCSKIFFFSSRRLFFWGVAGDIFLLQRCGPLFYCLLLKLNKISWAKKYRITKNTFELKLCTWVSEIVNGGWERTRLQEWAHDQKALRNGRLCKYLSIYF